jgi:hypothetical protein
LQTRRDLKKIVRQPVWKALIYFWLDAESYLNQIKKWLNQMIFYERVGNFKLR